MASLKYIQSSTLQAVTLGAGYTAASGTMTLTGGEGALLPSSGDFWLAYNNGSGTIRLFKVTARSTDTLTVVAVSGEGSGDGNISSGETLRWALTYDALQQLRADIASYGTYANLPATCTTGSTYHTSDSPYNFLATGTNTWTAFYRGGRVVVPPTAGWTTANSPTTAATYGVRTYSKAALSAVQLAMEYRTAPATPYVIKALVAFNHIGWQDGAGNATSSGISFGFRDSGGKYVTIRTGPSASNTVEITTDKWTNVTTFSALYKTFGPAGNLLGIINPLGVAWGDDGTDLKFWLSLDGFSWIQYDSRSRTDFMASGPDAVAWGAYPNASPVYMSLLSWEELASATP